MHMLGSSCPRKKLQLSIVMRRIEILWRLHGLYESNEKCVISFIKLKDHASRKLIFIVALGSNNYA